jgi:hypothetical protein
LITIINFNSPKYIGDPIGAVLANFLNRAYPVNLAGEKGYDSDHGKRGKT